MKTVVLCFLLSCTLVLTSDLYLGNPPNENLLYLLYHTQAKYRAIPFIRREKDIFYNQPTHIIIAKIEIMDNVLMSRARATVTAGGIGQSFVNIRLTSERGRGLNYDISIFGSVDVTTTLSAPDISIRYLNSSDEQ